jgi:UDP-2,3-diacylglucosamine pyrophosphatase LpxH
MQVFLSDTHFSDASIGDKSNIPGRAFTCLRDDLLSIINHADTRIRDVEIVLLGDVFDTLRTAAWRRPGPMPWDPRDQAMQERVSNILSGIIHANDQAFAVLRGLKQDFMEMAAPGKSVQNVRITYIPGNHDRNVNWFPETRAMAAAALGLESSEKFPTELFSEEYRVIARHGDIYDVTNNVAPGQASCLGDAVVVTLINTFPVRLEHHLKGSGRIPKWIIETASELDHLRPAQAIPAWINALRDEIHRREPQQGPDLIRAVDNAWGDAVAAFLDEPYVKSLDHAWNPFEPVDALKLLLKVPLGMTEDLGKLITRLGLGAGIGNVYLKAAGNEEKIRSGQADHVIYGHTHAATQLAINGHESDAQPQIYFNTGAWRKTVNQTLLDSPHSHDRRFVAWQIMAYAILYKPGENRRHRHEMWSGTRG